MISECQARIKPSAPLCHSKTNIMIIITKSILGSYLKIWTEEIMSYVQRPWGEMVWIETENVDSIWPQRLFLNILFWSLYCLNECKRIVTVVDIYSLFMSNTVILFVVSLHKNICPVILSSFIFLLDLSLVIKAILFYQTMLSITLYRYFLLHIFLVYKEI